MKERPILFSTEMVRAILEGRKTQTRRPVKGLQIPKLTGSDFDQFPDSRWSAVAQIDPRYGFCVFGATEEECAKNLAPHFCPHGKPGDRLWVRETWSENTVLPMQDRPEGKYIYRADRGPTGLDKWSGKWKPSIHMPRWASRITLEIVSVRVERLQDITEEDAIYEGMVPTYDHDSVPEKDATEMFQKLWDSINEKRAFGWDANPWVWVIEFKIVEGV